MDYSQIQELLGKEAESLLAFSQPKISKEKLHVPSATFIDDVFGISDRSDAVVTNLKRLRDSGRLKGTGYYSILPVDQGVEHSAGASFAKNPDYFDPENIVKLAIEGGCNAVASTLGVLSMTSKKYADKIPFIVKINHNELLSFPNDYDQIMFAGVDQAYSMGAAGVGATIYFGSPESKRQIQEISEAFQYAHELGMFTVLWCYLRSPAFSVEGEDYHAASDLTAQAIHLGATLGADIVKQKIATNNGGYPAVNTNESYGKYVDEMYSELNSNHPIDLCRYQVANSYMGRIGLINSGG
ncbi:class I fructose-bisphosphate aldolase, partial [Patescibacteria group bacterium]|nr:class I fructose-bisphosphate aldolase [Patescibacteria group bacterium]MBU1901652.1 class I fructose-bisphosphate aldolase [Patescibacteria group bacterium]